EQCNSDGCFKRGKKKRHSWRVGVHEYACTTYTASATDRTWTEYIINGQIIRNKYLNNCSRRRRLSEGFVFMNCYMQHTRLYQEDCLAYEDL
uniref:Uncharacterized protein n=1 Tax=Magallana gigas TaxID=29159 RepID=A0A8W8JDA2_MAGGI